jgi:hypothetical protein
LRGSLRARLAGQPLAAAWRGAYVGCKGDWKWLKEAYRMPGAYCNSEARRVGGLRYIHMHIYIYA